jgi:hypothetical protein
MEELEEHLERMKVLLYGEGDSEPDAAAVVALTVAASKDDFLRLLITYFPVFSFEVGDPPHSSSSDVPQTVESWQIQEGEYQT